MPEAINNMKKQGIWLNDKIIQIALQETNSNYETPASHPIPRQ